VEPDEELRAILRRAYPEGRVERASALSGGISARATVVDLRLGEEAKRVVVRRPRHAAPAEAQRIVRTEHALLGHLRGLGLPVPTAWFLDAEAAAVGLEHIEGAPDFAPASMSGMLEQMAVELVRLHALAVPPELGLLQRRTASFEQDFLAVPEKPDLALDEPRIRSVLAELWPWEQKNPDVILHGDYWPGNLLWRNGRLVALLDWEEAALGDPLADLAIARLDLLWAFGDSAMEELTERYRALSHLDWQHLACWDLAVALRPMSNLHRWASAYAAPPISRPDVTEASMRDGHRRFVQQALKTLSRA
jgi:aminoglycoside phosphotransferase (APT) family kinase protein